MDEEELEARRQLIEQIMEQARAGTLTSDSLAELAVQSTAAGKAQKEMTEATVKVVGGLGDFTRSVAGSNGEVTTMTGLVTSMGEAIGGLVSIVPGAEGAVKGLAAATNFAIGRMQASFESFNELSDAGLIGAEGITGLREDFDKARIPLETYSKMLKNNADDLSFIYGTALKGSEQFSLAMGEMMNGSNDQLRRMGFTVEEVGDVVIDFQAMNKRLGFSQEMSTAQLIKSATEYGTEMDELAKLTGTSRKDIQKQREEMMRDARFRAKIRTMEINGQQEQARELQNSIILTQKFAPEVAKGMMDLSTGFVHTEEARKLMVSSMGTSLMKSMKGIENGTVSALETFNVAVEGATDAEALQRGTTLAVGQLQAFISYIDVDDLKKRGKITQEEADKIVEAQKQQIAGTDDLTETMVTAQNALMASAVDLDKLSTSHGVAIGVVATFSEMMRDATDALRYLLDIEKPGIDEEQVHESLLAGETAPLEKKAEVMESDKMWQDFAIAITDFHSMVGGFFSDDLGDSMDELGEDLKDIKADKTAKLGEINAEISSRKRTAAEEESIRSTGVVMRGPGPRSSVSTGTLESGEESESNKSSPTTKSQAAKAAAERTAREDAQIASNKENNKLIADLKDELVKLGMINVQQLTLNKEQLEIIKAQLTSQQEAVRNQANR